jgi:enoyl reductase
MVAGVSVVLLVAGSTSASAFNGGKPVATTTTDTGKDGDTYHTHVTFTQRGGADAGDDSQPVTSSDADFAPPVCWYESMTPAEFEVEIDRRYNEAGAEHAGTIYDYYNQIQSQMNAIKYHQGDDGSWWVLAWDEVALNSGNAAPCSYDTGWLWQAAGTPEPAGTLTPEILSQAAYGRMKLPTRKVTLSPVPQNQTVNFPTYVSFAAAIPEVSVTAQLATVAATVRAVPYSLHVEAGTSYAAPASCDYTFTSSGGGYAVNSADAACNVTYQKANAPGSTYPLTAQITWHVTWTPTPTPQPDGEGMPNGTSQSQQAVTVQEIQTVNR